MVNKNLGVCEKASSGGLVYLRFYEQEEQLTVMMLS